MNLIQHAILFNAAAAVGNQYPGIRRDFLSQLRDLTGTEQHFSGGMKGKILHDFSSSLWDEQ